MVNFKSAFFSFFISLLSYISGQSQNPEQKLGLNDEDAPEWVKMINLENSNVFKVQKAYNQYSISHPKEKNTYTQYYKRWIQRVGRDIDENGFVKKLSIGSIDVETEKIKRIRQATNVNTRTANTANWTHAGPEIIYNALYNSTEKQLPITGQANVRSITFSISNPSVGYAASETGGVFKTTDKGQNWTFVTRDLPVVTSTPIEVNPVDPNECLFFSHTGEIIYKTKDGGTSWERIDLKAFVYEIRYNSSNPQIIYVATNKGIFKTTDSGKTWSVLLIGFCSSILLKPDNQETLYVLRKNEISKVMDFYKSVDGGKSFLKKDTGWFIPTGDDLGKIESDGGKLAVTPADPNRIYALLVGLDNPSNRDKFNGFIGVFVSKDSGESWLLPNGPVGRPYGQIHPNLMTYGPSGGGHQLYYNTTLAVSKINPDYLLIGGVTLWKSLDGAKTFIHISPTVNWLHPDMQDIETVKTSSTTEDVWIANDGGIQYSKDFMISFESRTKGIAGGTYWGFDQGQLEDVMIGGRYHNGNSAYLETYPSNNHLRIGGGEGATGYVNPADNRIVYASDIGTVKIPSLQNGVLQILGHPEFPHENYVRFLSSRMAFDPHYYNTVYIGKDNSLKKSTDGAKTYDVIKQFGANKENKIYWIEVSPKNSNLIFLDQKLLDQPDASIFWNTRDGGNSWEQVKLPLTKRDFLFTISSRDEKELWIAFPFGANEKKVFKSLDGGKTWQNLTTPTLNGAEIAFIVHQAGTNGGIYLGLSQGAILYKNDSMADWVSFSEGLPIAAQCLRLVPFYKKEKLRYASRTHSIWESDFYEPSKPVAIMSASKKYISCNAVDNSVEFLDLSDHRRTNISRIWSFQGGNPVSSTLERPTVRYDKPGKYKVSLTVSDDRGSSTEAIDDFIIVEPFVEITPYNFTCQADTVQLEATTANQGYTYQWKKDDKVITNSNSRYYSALEDGEYSVIAQKDGCSFESSKTKITVLKRLSGTILGIKDICTGASINLTAKGIGGKPPYSYQWFRNGISLNKTDSLLSISEAGFYSLIVSDSRGCRTNSGDNRILLKGDKLSASIKPNGNITINQYETVLLKANADTGFTYQWLKDNKEIPKATDVNYEVKETGSYTVKIFFDGCFVISEPVIVTVIPVTSLSKITNSIFEIFPNPMVNNCIVKISLPSQDEAKLDLVDLQGRILRTWELGIIRAVDREISLDRINEGEYIFILHLPQNQLSKKVIISRKE